MRHLWANQPIGRLMQETKTYAVIHPGVVDSCVSMTMQASAMAKCFRKEVGLSAQAFRRSQV